MLNKNINIEFKPFLRWWKRELAFLMPAKIRAFFHTPRVAVIIRANGETFELSEEINGIPNVLMTILPNSANTESVTNLFSEPRFKNAIFVLRLSNRDALHKTLNLPIAAKSNVSQIIGYEIDRYSPFKADQVYFSTQIKSVDTEAAQLTVNLMLLPRKLLENLHQRCRVLGISPHFVDVENCPNDLHDLHSTYNLLPTHLQPKISNRSRWIIGGLLSLLTSLSITALILPIYLEYQSVESLQNQISSIEKDVKAVKNLQADMDVMREENQMLINEKNSSPSVVAILNEISALLKDDSWLSYLQYSDGQLQLQGESPTASNLLADLEASDYFAKVNFASPVTQDKASGMERFQIAADITKPENTDAPIDTTEEAPVDDATTDEAVIENDTSKE